MTGRRMSASDCVCYVNGESADEYLLVQASHCEPFKATLSDAKRIGTIPHYNITFMNYGGFIREWAKGAYRDRHNAIRLFTTQWAFLRQDRRTDGQSSKQTDWQTGELRNNSSEIHNRGRSRLQRRFQATSLNDFWTMLVRNTSLTQRILCAL